MTKKFLVMLLLSCLFIGCEAEKDDSDDGDRDSSSTNTTFRSCFSTFASSDMCFSIPENVLLEDAEDMCDTTDGDTQSTETECPGQHNNAQSAGVCTVTLAGVDFGYRFYANDANTEETYCTTLVNAAPSGATGSWQAD